MTYKKIIPCLDVINGRVVKGKRFEDIEDVEDMISLAKLYNLSGADEIVFYDITASCENRGIFMDSVKRIAKEVTIPLIVGGGIRSIEDFKEALDSGASKVSINSSAIKNKSIIKEASSMFGKSCVVLSMDIKKNKDGIWKVYEKGGKEETELEAVKWAIEGESLGAGEIVVNCIDTDGVREGYDIEITKEIANAVNIPVIASGGAGKKEDFLEVLTKGDASSALAASVFHYRDVEIEPLKEYLLENNVNVIRR